MTGFCIAVLACVLALESPARGQGAAPQNPSPMVETTRSHPRLEQSTPPGRREPLEVGTLFLPARLTAEPNLPLVVHFHGAPWISEVAGDRLGSSAIITVQLGSGSAVYAKPFSDPGLFTKLLDQAEAKAGVRLDSVTLSAWSAGYGAIREILSVPNAYERVHRVLLIDALHTGYVGGKPGPRESQLEVDKLQPFLRFARDAAAGKKQMLITHTEIFPGTFASTTETADYLIRELGLRRTAVLRWGPMGTQQLSDVCQGSFRVMGFAGNSAPDHVDQLHALSDFFKWQP